MTSSNNPFTTSHSSSPPPPVRQLLTANRIAPAPRHFVPVTYIRLVPLMACVRFEADARSEWGKRELAEPRKSTMFRGMMAVADASWERLRSSYSGDASR